MKAINKIETLANWKSKDLFADSSWIYQFTEDDLIELNEALNFLKKSNLAIENINRHSFPLFNLSKKMTDISQFLENNRGIFLLRGFPVEKYNEEDVKKIFLGLGAYLGTAINQSSKGELVYEVMDKGVLIKDGARGTATKENLPFHTDRCDVVALLCLKKSKSGGESRVVSSIAIHNEILEKNYDLLLELYNPYFHARTTWETETASSYYPLPIFTIYEGYFAARYLRHFINVAQTFIDVPKITKKQLAAIDLVEKIASDNEFCADMEFLPGDIQLLNNFVSLHSRAGYIDHDEVNQKRKLLRLWLSVPNSRPLSPLFAPLYHSTTAGAIRGGVKN